MTGGKFRSAASVLPFDLSHARELPSSAPRLTLFATDQQGGEMRWGHETSGAIRQAAQRANWIVDVGAGSGELCILAAKLKNVTRIIAIEPDQTMVESLQANIDHNEFMYNDILSGRIEIIEKFIGTQNDDRYIMLDQLNIDHSLHGFIKIGVDGSEFEVLRSGQQLLSYTNVEILVGTHSSELERNCVHFLEDVGYTCRFIKNAWWRSLIPEQRPREHNRWLFATPAGSHGLARRRRARWA
jgi:SAM-dependent methyltransferase